MSDHHQHAPSGFNALAILSWVGVSIGLGYVALSALVAHGSGVMTAALSGGIIAVVLCRLGLRLYQPQAGTAQPRDWFRIAFKVCTALTALEVMFIWNVRAIVSIVSGEPPTPEPTEAPTISAEDKRYLLLLALGLAIPPLLGTATYWRSLYVRYVLRRNEMAWAFHSEGAVNWMALIYFGGFALMVSRLG